MKAEDIAAAVEQIAPLGLAQDWDNVGLLIGDPAQDVKKVLLTIDVTKAVVAEARKLTEARSGFALLSEQMLALAKRLGPPAGTPLFEMKCPMAFDNRGARWLQSDSRVRNPYFGAAMLECGEVVEVIKARPTAQEESGNDGHEHP